MRPLVEEERGDIGVCSGLPSGALVSFFSLFLGEGFRFLELNQPEKDALLVGRHAPLACESDRGSASCQKDALFPDGNPLGI